MGMTAKSKTKTYIENCPGMSFLLLFFPAEEDRHTTTTKPPTIFKRPISHANPILTKAQSTISICILLLFLTLLLFTLSSFQPSSTSPPRAPKPPLVALQGMGKLHLRGTRPMADLLVCHVSEETDEDHFKVFFRLLLRSGLLSRSDVVFLFPNSSFSVKFEALITREGDAFLRLLEYYYTRHLMHKKMNRTSFLGFDVARFLREKEGGDPLWGRNLKVVNNDDINKNRSNIPGSNSTTESTRPSYGSVVSFEAGELDPENSLSGFLDHVPMGTRRWACYPMLLGRVRRNFKHVVLVDVRGSLLMGDPLARAGTRMSSESVYVFGRPTGRRNVDKTQSLGRVDSTFLMGGGRGVRRLSSSMLTEIARVAMQQRKRRNSVTESWVLSQLVGNEHILKSVDIVEATESLPELSSLSGLRSNFNSSSRDSHYNWSVIRRGNGNIWELNSAIMKLICDCEVDSSVYRDC